MPRHACAEGLLEEEAGKMMRRVAASAMVKGEEAGLKAPPQGGC